VLVIAGGGEMVDARPRPVRAAEPKWRRLGPLTRASGLASQIAALEGGAVPASGRWLTSQTIRTTTGIVVVRLKDSDGFSVIVKLAANANAGARLEHETIALRAMHADDRLGRWRAVVPMVLADGYLRGRPYRVESPSTAGALARRGGRWR
jgi:hypothetical protein